MMSVNEMLVTAGLLAIVAFTFSLLAPVFNLKEPAHQYMLKTMSRIHMAIQVYWGLTDRSATIPILLAPNHYIIFKNTTYTDQQSGEKYPAVEIYFLGPDLGDPTFLDTVALIFKNNPRGINPIIIYGWSDYSHSNPYNNITVVYINTIINNTDTLTLRYWHKSLEIRFQGLTTYEGEDVAVISLTAFS